MTYTHVRLYKVKIWTPAAPCSPLVLDLFLATTQGPLSEPLQHLVTTPVRTRGQRRFGQPFNPRHRARSDVRQTEIEKNQCKNVADPGIDGIYMQCIGGIMNGTKSTPG